MTTVKIVPSVLKKQVSEGMKLTELVAYYNLPTTQMKKALKQLDLRIKKFYAPKFEFDTEEPVKTSFQHQDTDLGNTENSSVENNAEIPVLDNNSTWA